MGTRKLVEDLTDALRDMVEVGVEFYDMDEGPNGSRVVDRAHEVLNRVRREGAKADEEVVRALEVSAEDHRLMWQFLDALCLNDGSVDRRKARDAAWASYERALAALKGRTA